MKKRTKKNFNIFFVSFIFLVIFIIKNYYFTTQDQKVGLIKKKDIKVSTRIITLEKKQQPNLISATPPFSSNSKLKKQVTLHLKKIEFVGEGADKAYQESLNELRKNKEAVTNFLIGEYKSTKEENYIKRQQLFETMRALHSKNSIPVFNEILMEKFPEEKSEDLHHGSTQLEEGIIRLTAIEGLGHFAKEENNEEILLTLLEIIKNKESPLPLKRQAVREYLHSSSNEKKLAQSKELIKEYLPKSEHFIVTKKIDDPEEQLPDTESPGVENDHDQHHQEHHDSESPKI
jgi:hypothetical protein